MINPFLAKDYCILFKKPMRDISIHLLAREVGSQYYIDITPNKMVLKHLHQLYHTKIADAQYSFQTSIEARLLFTKGKPGYQFSVIFYSPES